jgi:16S rRNA (cytosine967-C5)-methyltransferase
VTPKDIENLAVLQGELIDAAVTLLKPGGVLVYSVCTVTMAETVTIAEAATGRHELVPIPIGDERWTAVGTGARLLPQDHDTDAMVIFAWTTGAASD